MHSGVKDAYCEKSPPSETGREGGFLAVGEQKARISTPPAGVSGWYNMKTEIVGGA